MKITFIDNSNKKHSFDYAQLAYIEGWAKPKPPLQIILNNYIGVGNVGGPLADHLQKLGHEVTIAARNPDSQSVQNALSRNSHFVVKAPIAAVEEADIV